MTETIDVPLASTAVPEPLPSTEFEKRRGVSGVEVRPGFAQAHVSRLAGNLTAERLRVLRAVSDAGVSIDFLKLTPSGLSFLIPASQADRCESVFEPLGVHSSVRRDRTIVLVHAVNVRDEEGLTATIVQHAIASGAAVDHVTDMHDRLLMVVERGHAAKLASYLEKKLEVTA